VSVVQDCHFKPICVLASWTESAWLLLPVVPEGKDCLSKLGDPGDIGGSMLSKSTSYVFMPGFFRLAGELGIGWLGSLPNGCGASTWYHGGERTCSALGAA
jgi:hypothetical protein